VSVPERLRELLSRSIEDLAEMSVRSRNSLQKENILTLGELVLKTEDEMLAIDNFGRKSLKEIEDFLEGHGLHFGMKIEEGDDGRLFFLDGHEPAEAGEL
jgi:DNA-directed RNA polymerase subunit alpha